VQVPLCAALLQVLGQNVATAFDGPFVQAAGHGRQQTAGSSTLV
jgi:hypothetical protein